MLDLLYNRIWCNMLPRARSTLLVDFFNDLNWAVFALDSNGVPTIDKHIIESSRNLFAMPRRISSDFLGRSEI